MNDVGNMLCIWVLEALGIVENSPTSKRMPRAETRLQNTFKAAGF